MKSQPQLLTGQRQNEESPKAVLACNDYLRLGPGRSLAKLLDRYRTGAEVPPTRRLNTLKTWSTGFDWQDRASAYDSDIERQKNEALEARRRAVMQSGLALDFERVLELKRLADFLITQVYERGEKGDFHNVWLPDVKQIGSGEDAERVDIERFNGALIEQVRGTLDDLAKETGGRKQKLEHRGEMAVVGMTLTEWKKRQEQNRQQAQATLADFAADDEGADG